MMETSIIRTDHTMQELERHGTDEYPILISCGLSLSHDTGIVSWHWHNDFELTYLVSGHFNFSAGSDTFLLNPGEAIFINSKILHQVKPAKNERPIYYSYAFAPEFISGTMHSLVAAKYIIPLMHNYNFPYYVFHNNTNWEEQCLAHIHLLNQAADSECFQREFQIQNSLQTIFIDMIQNFPEICTKSDRPANHDNYSIMNIMLYIKEHYSETISLSDIADAANISKSTCNRIFHNTLKMTPFEYLLDFRINQSKQLLGNSSHSITEIAYSCGFHDNSYYCKIFRRHTGISPQKYRRNVLSGTNSDNH